MNKVNIYHFLMGITGLSIGLVSFRGILSEGFSLGASLMAVGAFVLLVQAGYHLFIEESVDLNTGESVEIAAISAVLCSIGALLNFLT